jgi:hypothetical protein
MLSFTPLISSNGTGSVNTIEQVNPDCPLVFQSCYNSGFHEVGCQLKKYHGL